jgi:butyrate kinase
MSDSSKIWKLLIINPGSTSTKISVYENETSVMEESIFHDSPLLLKFAHVNDQIPFRYQVICDMLKEHNIDPSQIDAFVGRGGSAYSQPGGVTLVDELLYQHTADAVGGSEHPAKLGVMLAWEFAQEYGRSAYTLNPTNTEEFCDYARLTGLKGVYRYSHSHVLNQKAVATHYAEAHGKEYEDCRFIVAHIDGGITVSAHEHGHMIDGNMGADGDGAFSPTRMGSVPVPGLLNYIRSHSMEDVELALTRAGGFASYFGTTDSDKIHALVEAGDPKAVLVWNTMIYQICKMIGEMSAVLCGRVDAILLTGGLMRFDDITEGIRKRCGWIAPIHVYPGEMEQEALALAVLKVLRGQATAMTYSGKNVWQGFEGVTF